MPQYIFENPKTGETVEVYQSMKEVHEYERDGVKWNRIFTVPQASVDSKFNCWSSHDFVRKTANKKGTYGDLLDKSKELSERRAKESGGVDPMREKKYDEYQKKTGKRHPQKIKEEWKNKVVEI